jgi:translocation and assembly module TamA
VRLYSVLFSTITISFLGFVGSVNAFELTIQAPNNPAISDQIASTSLLSQLSGKESSPTQDIVAAARADYERIVSTLYGLGYFSSVVRISLDGREAASISTISPPKTIRSAKITIDPGPIFTFGKTSIAPLAPMTELPPNFAPGASAQIRTIQNASNAAIEGWRNTGHAKAKLKDQQITARHRESQINAELNIDPGPKLTFGELVVLGNKAVRTERIIDIAGLPTGKVYSPVELNRAANRLRRTGTFRVAALSEAKVFNPNLSLDVDAQITENLPRRLGFGAEISSLEGLGLSAFWLHRNLFGGAERLRVEGNISGIGGNSGGTDYSVRLRFDRPATFNEDTDFYALAEVERLDEVSFQSDQVSLEMGIKRYASEKREYTFGLGLRSAKVSDTFGNRSYTLLTAPMSTTFDYRDNKLSAKDGYFINAALTPFLAVSGSQNGARSYVDARAFKSFGKTERFTFALRGQLGALTGPDLSNAPADFVFYSGGSGTVRGQDYQSLAIDLGNGQEVGGRSFLGISGELRIETSDKLSLVGFYDAGYIGREEFPDGNTGTWHSGAGIGVRYDTGIGPIRLDIAVPVSGPGKQSGFEVYIGIGQAF